MRPDVAVPDPMSSGPDVSVLLTCFNQAAFVAEAVDSILAQDAGLLEVVVADDASEDGTRAVALARLSQRPGLPVRALPRDRRAGATRNFFRGVAACAAPFVAVLEGDDYWTDPQKLSLQRAVLLERPECTVCAGNFEIMDMATGARTLRAPAGDGVRLCGPEALIADNLPGNMSAAMYRRAVFPLLPAQLPEVRCGDWLLNICAAELGPLAFMHRPMSIYRKNAGGIWASLGQEAQLRLLVSLVEEYDGVTGGRHREAFAQAGAGFRRELTALQAACT